MKLLTQINSDENIDSQTNLQLKMLLLEALRSVILNKSILYTKYL